MQSEFSLPLALKILSLVSRVATGNPRYSDSSYHKEVKAKVRMRKGNSPTCKERIGCSHGN
jgi:hypothetical protein